VTATADDDSASLWLDQLDLYLTAIQRGDVAEQRRLLALDPALADWTQALQQFDDFATVLDEFANTSDPVTQPISFGKYELRDELGRGGMGVVFRAYQTDLSRQVALKMLTSSTLATADQRRRFLQEARLASRIRHQNIVTIHDVGEIGGQPYFTMDLIQGTSLASRLRQGQLPIDQAVQWMIQISHAVEHLHRNDVIHRDLKPSNVLLNESGQPCLVDFGLARALDETHDPTVTGTILGTPSYMSPEQAAGRVREVTVRSDVYSLGAMLYEMLSGRPPFVASSPFDTVLQVLEREPLPLRHWNRAIPRTLEQICLRCLEKSPELRYASALELAEDLQRYLQGETPLHASSSPIVRVRRTIWRHPAAAYRLIALAPIIIVVLVRSLMITDGIDFYAPFLCGLSLWLVLSFLWEWFSSQPKHSAWTAYAFALTDIGCLTIVLQVLQKADIAFVMAYGLPILMAGLSLNRRLITVTGSCCILGYLYLVSQSTDLSGWHIPLIMVVLLSCFTIVTDYQVRRLSVWVRSKMNGAGPA